MTTFDMANKLEAFHVLLMYFFNDMSEALEEAGVEPDSDNKRAMAHEQLEKAIDLLGGALEKLQTAAKAEELDREDVGLPEGDDLDLGLEGLLDPDDMIGMGRGGRRPTGPSVLDGEERPAKREPAIV